MGKPEPVIVNVYGAQESISPGWESILGLLKGLQIRAQSNVHLLYVTCTEG
jgi:hypothetical protein